MDAELLPIAVVGLCVLLSLPAVVCLVRGRRIDYFWPPILFSFIVLLGHVLPIPRFLAQQDLISLEFAYLFEDGEGALLRAVLYACMGVAAFYVGWLFCPARPRADESRPFAWRTDWLIVFGVTYTVCGLGLFAIGLGLLGGPTALIAALADRTRAFAGLNYFFFALSLLPTFALVWWIYLLTQRTLRVPAFWAYAVVAFGSSAFMGGKLNMFLGLLAGLIAFHLLYRPISTRVFLLGLVVGFLGLTIFDMIFREYLIVGQFIMYGTDLPMSERILRMLDRQLDGNFMQIQVLSVVVDAVPARIPFQAGATYLWLATAPIPSSLWTDKPFPSPGVVTFALWPEHWFGNGTTMPPGLMGEMFLNFGAPGIAIGMLLFGALYKYAYLVCLTGPRDPFRIAFYCLLLGMMVYYVRGDFAAPTVLLLINGLPVLAMAPFAGRLVSCEEPPPRVVRAGFEA